MSVYQNGQPIKFTGKNSTLARISILKSMREIKHVIYENRLGMAIYISKIT